MKVKGEWIGCHDVNIFFFKRLFWSSFLITSYQISCDILCVPVSSSWVACGKFVLEDVKFIMPLELQSARQLALVATKSGAGGIVSDKHPGNMIR